jgi:hypothetical protein
MAREAAVGDAIPPVALALTVQRMVMEAGASRDFMPVHHDARVAHAQGAPDMYASTFLVTTLMERTLRAWAGNAARILRLGPFRMTRFACVGRVLTCRGRIAAVEGDEVEVDVWMDDGEGETMRGRARVRLSASS